jgi:acetylglutamate kinase
MNTKPKIIDGRRITDLESLKMVQMVYAVLIIKNIMAKLQSLNCPVIGLGGNDANCILAEKRPVTNNIDYGFVGDIKKINNSIIVKFLKEWLIPVFCALTHDGKRQMLNTNSDTIAAELGAALSKTYTVDLVYCFEKDGALTDVNDNKSQIKQIISNEYNQLKADKIISDGMIPKIDNAFQAHQKGVKNVFITHYSLINQTDSIGTRISLE